MEKDLNLLRKLRSALALSRRGKPKGTQGSLPCGSWRVLELLSLQQAQTQQQLASELNIRPQSVSEALVALEKQGYVRRICDEKDRRARLITLTEQGEETLRLIRLDRQKRAQTLFAPLSGEEKVILDELLTKIIVEYQEDENDAATFSI